MRTSIKVRLSVAVIAAASSGYAVLPGATPLNFIGDAYAANANSDGNGSSATNSGNGGQSASAGPASGGSPSSNASSGGGPASAPEQAGSPPSGQGQGGGLERLLATGIAKPSSDGVSGPSNVATGAPLQLLPPQANGGVGTANSHVPVGPPDPKPGAPASVWAHAMAEASGLPPGEYHRLLGAGHSYFNSSDMAKANAADDSRPKRVERYLQANAVAQTALAAVGGVVPTDAAYAGAQAYLEAANVIANSTVASPADAQAIVAAYEADPQLPGPSGLVPTDAEYAEAQAYLAAQGVIDGSTIASAADAQAIIDAYEAEAAAVGAFEEADNQPYDPERRAAYDSLAAYMGIAF